MAHTGTDVTIPISYYMVLYGAAGVFGGLFLAFVDNGIGAGTKRKQLADHLVDYVENSPHFYKSVDNIVYAGQERKKAVGASPAGDFSGSGTGYGRTQESVRNGRGNGRFSVLRRKKDAQISDESDETENLENENLTRTGDAVKLSRLDGKTSVSEGNGPAVNGNSIGSSSKKPTGKTDYNRSTGQNARDAGSKSMGTGGKVLTSETELAQSINHLSESLRQIAASREQPGESQKMPDDLELIRNSIPAEEMALLKTLFNTLLLFFPRPRRFQPFFTVALRGIQRAVFLCKFSSDFIVGFFVSHITRFGRSIHGMRIEIKMQLPKRELKRAEL